MTNRISVIVLIISFLSFAELYGQAKFEATWESLDSRSIPGWFEDAKFGIFIHWGVYSVPAYRAISNKLYASYAEWYYARVKYDTINGGAEFHNNNFGSDFDYREFGPLFKAELFDPDQWADLFSRSGARYVVLTSKHHDGYCLWPTDSPYKADWNCMTVGPKRDLLGDLTKAVRAREMRMGLYYSIVEWETTPTKRTNTGYFLPEDVIEKYKIPYDQYVPEHVIPQLKDLVMNYEPALIFSDGGEWDGDEEYWQTKEFLAWLYNKAPNKDEVVVNDRWCKGMPGNHGDYFSSEYKDTDAIGTFHPWEESRGIGGSYGYNRAENIDDYNTSEELVHELIEIVGNGGNLLLNVGPTADGRIPVIMQQRLIDIGAWLEVNGEAIYGSRPLSTSEKDKININSSPTPFFTKKDHDLFLIFTDYPDSEVILNGITTDIEIQLLGSDKEIICKKDKDQIRFALPTFRPGQEPCSYAWVVKISKTK